MEENLDLTKLDRIVEEVGGGARRFDPRSAKGAGGVWLFAVGSTTADR